MGAVFFVYYLFMIVVKYTLFAVLSTMLNLLCQYIVFSVYAGFYSLYLAMFVTGLTIGYIIKYFLDKKYVFQGSAA